MAYIVPQVLVYQEFQLIPAAITQPLRACIVGPVYDPIIRYSNDGEKQRGYLGMYQPTLPAGVDLDVYPWPERGSSVVDHDFTKLTFEDAFLEFFRTDNDWDIKRVSGTRNRIKAEADRHVFAGTYLDGSTVKDVTDLGLPYNADGSPRDIQIGDRVSVWSEVGPPEDKQIYDLDTYVLGLVAEPGDADVGAFTAANTNQPTIAATTVDDFTNYGQAVGAQIEVAGVDASSYSGLRDGFVTDTYTVEVTQGGGAGVARFRVISASGLDNQANIEYQGVGEQNSIEIGTRGLEIEFVEGSSGSTDPEHLRVGHRWTFTVRSAFTAPAIGRESSADTYGGTRDTNYIVEIVRGGIVGDPEPDKTPRYIVYTDNGYDSGTEETLASANNPVGTHGITFMTSSTEFRRGDRFVVSATAAADGEVKTLILGHALPDEIGETDLINVYFGVRRTLDVPQFRPGGNGLRNWIPSDREISIKQSIELTVPDIWHMDGSDLVMKPLPVDFDSAKMYLTYRAVSQRNLRTLGTITGVSEIPEHFGILDIDQPMSVAVEKAIANASGTPVHYLPVPADTVEGYMHALDILVGTDSVYGLVPLTFDRQVQNLFASHVQTMSSPENGRWRITFISTPAVTEKPIVVEDTAGSELLARVENDPQTQAQVGTRVLIQTPSGQEPVDLPIAGVRAGDVLRINYRTNEAGEVSFHEYPIDEVVSADEVVLQHPGLGVETFQEIPVKVEFWRRLTTTETVREVGTLAGSFFSRRVYNIWPDYIGSAGIQYPGYIAAAAVAGQASGVVPQQGHTNLELAGFDDVSRTTEFLTQPQLNELASAGVYIITQDPRSGKVYTRHELSTNMTDVNTRELMVTKNVDAMSYVYLRTLEPFIGISNVTPTMRDRLDTEIQATTTYLKTNGFLPRLGSQLIDGRIVQLERHPVLRDRIVAVLELEIPYPLNNIQLHLVVPA